MTVAVASVESDRRALPAAAVAAFVWGFGSLLVRGVHAPASVIAFWRFALAQPVMIGAAYLSGGGLSWRLLRRTSLPASRCSGRVCMAGGGTAGPGYEMP